MVTHKSCVWAPEGPLIIAQRFIAGSGSWQEPAIVPEGQLNDDRRATFQSSLRDEEPFQASDLPSTEVLGYCQTSLRDGNCARVMCNNEDWRPWLLAAAASRL